MSGRRVFCAGRAAYVGTGSGQPAAAAPAAPAAPALLFVHGAGMDHTVWALPARHFARKGWRVLAVDLPGHGRSEGPPLESIEAMADWLAALLDALEVATAAVAGHSMGSLVAWQLARAKPTRCRALALLGTSAPMPVTAPLLAAAADNHQAAIDMANGWSHSPAGRLGAGGNPGVWQLGAGARLLERAAPGVLHADLAACNAYQPVPSRAEVACPVTVVVGDADMMTPAKAGLAVAAQLPGARTVRLPGCGHAMLSEQPNEVLDALNAAFAHS